ncbi:hypothetical protein [Pseudolactococcus yaeyamensis]
MVFKRGFKWSGGFGLCVGWWIGRNGCEIARNGGISGFVFDFVKILTYLS